MLLVITIIYSTDKYIKVVCHFFFYNTNYNNRSRYYANIITTRVHFVNNDKNNINNKIRLLIDYSKKL